MVGSALFVLPIVKYAGLLLLLGAVPLASKFNADAFCSYVRGAASG